MTHEKLTMAQALNRALRDALAEDLTVLVFGEDVGRLGGVFRITDGLTAEFGENRCFDTPLAESGIVGMAVGLDLPQPRAERFHVDPEIIAPSQINRFPVSIKPGATRGSIEGGQGAAQAGPRPRSVVFGPEQGGQGVAGLPLAGDSQVGHESDRLAAAYIHWLAVQLQARLAK